MDKYTRALTGTSQGATPIADGGMRAAILFIANATSQLLLDYFNADISVRAYVASILNPLMLILFGVWDKIDSVIQARAGVTTSPSVTQVPSTKVEPE